MKNIRKLVGFTFAIVALVFAVGGAFGFFDLGFLTGDGFVDLGFAAGAAATSSDTVTTSVKAAKSPDLLRPEIDKKIVAIQPDKFPFDTIMRNAGIVKNVSSYETKYYSSETRGLVDTVDTLVGAYTGDVAQHKTVIKVDNIHIWNVHDQVLVHGVLGNDGWPLILLVVAKDNDAHTLSCLVQNGTGTNGWNTAAIADATALGRVGHAKSELDAMTTPYGIMPQPSSNYCQTNMAMVEESLVAKMHNQEVKWDIADMYNMALWDFRGQNEYIGLMGAKSLMYDDIANNNKYTAGGIIRQISNNELIWDPASMGNADFQSWTKSIFTGNNGSESRIMFAGSNFMEALGSVPTVQKQMEAKSTEVVHGVRFHRIESNFGELLIRHHSGLHVLGMEDSGVVLDMAFIEKHVFIPLKTSKKDLVTSGIRKADASVIDETFCMVAKNLDTHAIINKKAS